MLDYRKYHVCIYENSEEYQKQIEECKKYSCNKVIEFGQLVVVLIPFGDWHSRGLKQGNWVVEEDKIVWKYISEKFKSKYKNVGITTQYLRGVLNVK